MRIAYAAMWKSRLVWNMLDVNEMAFTSSSFSQVHRLTITMMAIVSRQV